MSITECLLNKMSQWFKKRKKLEFEFIKNALSDPSLPLPFLHNSGLCPGSALDSSMTPQTPAMLPKLWRAIIED